MEAEPADREPGSGSPPVPVALIGLMGSGKSAVGASLAATSGRTLVDVDRLIFEQTGVTVRQLWERGGEAAYRPLERDAVVHTLAAAGPIVLAVPGGAVLESLVIEAFEAADVFTVWLRAEVATVVARVARDDHRPLLGDDPAGTLARMAAERSTTYEALADLVIDVEGRTADEIANLVTAAADHHHQSDQHDRSEEHTVSNPSTPPGDDRPVEVPGTTEEMAAAFADSLAHVRYPAGREELLAAARDRRAPDWVVGLLEGLDDQAPFASADAAWAQASGPDGS
ncbi:hypothetical protein BH20ACT3_BH20ACT3_15230 [soil metagenome]